MLSGAELNERKFPKSRLFCLWQEVFIYLAFSHSSTLLFFFSFFFFARHQNLLIRGCFFSRAGTCNTQHAVPMAGGCGVTTRCSYSWPSPLLRTPLLFPHHGGDLLGDQRQRSCGLAYFWKLSVKGGCHCRSILHSLFPSQEQTGTYLCINVSLAGCTTHISSVCV